MNSALGFIARGVERVYTINSKNSSANGRTKARGLMVPLESENQRSAKNGRESSAILSYYRW